MALMISLTAAAAAAARTGIYIAWPSEGVSDCRVACWGRCPSSDLVIGCCRMQAARSSCCSHCRYVYLPGTLYMRRARESAACLRLPTTDEPSPVGHLPLKDSKPRSACYSFSGCSSYIGDRTQVHRPCPSYRCRVNTVAIAHKQN